MLQGHGRAKRYDADMGWGQLVQPALIPAVSQQLQQSRIGAPKKLLCWPGLAEG